MDRALAGTLYMIIRLLILGCLIYAAIGLCELNALGIAKFLFATLIAWMLWASGQVGKGDKGE